MTELNLIGVASGIAANNVGTGDGPLVLQRNHLIEQLQKKGLSAQWLKMLTAESAETKLQSVELLTRKIAETTSSLAQQHKSFIVIGGDHSCAIGTWSGAHATLHAKGQLGLIWIDAHMDSHTFASTKSGNIHGMPLASLLGHGEPELTTLMTSAPKFLPENVVLIGVRSFESGEEELLKRLNVKIYFMEEIQQRGFATVFSEALQMLKQQTIAYGISLDLDALDPADAPGVGCRELNGIRAVDLLPALREVAHEKKFIGLEIVEFNPHLDHNQKTENLIVEIIANCYV